MSHVEPSTFPYICLRLPDVIGPYDRSGRFWAYMMWIKNNSNNPLHINKHSDLRLLSMVYSRDVVEVICKLLEKIRQKDFTFV